MKKLTLQRILITLDLIVALLFSTLISVIYFFVKAEGQNGELLGKGLMLMSLAIIGYLYICVSNFVYLVVVVFTQKYDSHYKYRSSILFGFGLLTIFYFISTTFFEGLLISSITWILLLTIVLFPIFGIVVSIKFYFNQKNNT